jgi:hypothetical protein
LGNTAPNGRFGPCDEAVSAPPRLRRSDAKLRFGETTRDGTGIRPAALAKLSVHLRSVQQNSKNEC